MSAYVLEESKLRRIVAIIEWSVNGGRDKLPFMSCDESQHFITIRKTNYEWSVNLFHDMLDMNCKAVETRYARNATVPDRLCERDIYSYHFAGMPGTDEELYRLLGTYLYQCSEGDVPSMPLYIMVDGWHNRLAHMIARKFIDRE